MHKIPFLLGKESEVHAIFDFYFLRKRGPRYWTVKKEYKPSND